MIISVRTFALILTLCGVALTLTDLQVQSHHDKTEESGTRQKHDIGNAVKGKLKTFHPGHRTSYNKRQKTAFGNKGHTTD